MRKAFKFMIHNVILIGILYLVFSPIIKYCAKELGNNYIIPMICIVIYAYIAILDWVNKFYIRRISYNRFELKEEAKNNKFKSAIANFILVLIINWAGIFEFVYRKIKEGEE